MIPKIISTLIVVLLISCSSFKPINIGTQYKEQIELSERKALKSSIVQYQYIGKNVSEDHKIYEASKFIVKIDSHSIDTRKYQEIVSALNTKGIKIDNNNANAIIDINQNSCQSVVGRELEQYFILIGYYEVETYLIKSNCLLKLNGMNTISNIRLEFESKARYKLNEENTLYIGPIPIRWNNNINSEELINDY